MATTKPQIISLPDLTIDEELKERLGTSPLFPKKMMKAISIMKVVRERQQKQS